MSKLIKYARFRRVLVFMGDLPMFLLMLWLLVLGMCRMILCLARAGIEEPIPQLLEGLEYIFLAPLGFLLFRGISDYVIAVIGHEDPQRVATHFLMRIKALILGLMAAVAGTGLLRRALSDRSLTYEAAISGCLFIIVMGGLSLAVERSVRISERDDAHAKALAASADGLKSVGAE